MKLIIRHPFPKRDTRPRAVTVIREGDRVSIVGTYGANDIALVIDPDSLSGVRVHLGSGR